MKYNILDKNIFTKRYIFLPTGATIEKLFAKVQPKFSRHSMIIPVDERITHNPDLKNLNKIHKMVGNKANIVPLARHLLRHPEQSCVILSVAEDFHFASIFPQKGDLNKRGYLINTQSSEPKINRTSIGYLFLNLATVIFLFKNRTRYLEFLQFIKSRHKLKAIFQQSFKIIL